MSFDGRQSYVYGPGGETVEQISAGGTVQYLHVDQLGSTRLITNESGGTVGSMTYTAYGTLAGSTGTVSTPLGFAGGYTDAETGLIYLNARYYDPTTGQFISVDPLDVLTQQPYEYADSNPVGEIDPGGNWAGISWLPSPGQAASAVWSGADAATKFVWDNRGAIAESATMGACLSGAVDGVGDFACLAVTGGAAATQTQQTLSSSLRPDQKAAAIMLDSLASVPGIQSALGMFDAMKGAAESVALKWLAGATGAGGIIMGGWLEVCMSVHDVDCNLRMSRA